MPEMSAGAATSWLALATGPYGGAFVMGLLFGAIVGIYFWQKFHVRPRLEAEQSHCMERMATMQRELDEVKTVAKKWEVFMERKALEALERM
jgi:galactitol-specific phosphotransferase system IIC component